MQILSRLGEYYYFSNNVASWGKDFKLNTRQFGNLGHCKKQSRIQLFCPIQYWMHEYWKPNFHSEKPSNAFRHVYAGEIWKSNIRWSVWICRKTRRGKSHHYCDLIVFGKLRFQFFLFALKRQAGFFNSSNSEKVEKVENLREKR